MILTDKVKIKIFSSNLKHYNSIGFDVKYGDVIEIRPELLSKGSHHKVLVKCDVCGFERELIYKRYYDNVSIYDTYCCSNKCAYYAKNQKTNMIRHGNKSFNNINKIRKTCLDKYGFECSLQNQEVKDKIEKTIQNKYGVTHQMRSEEIFKKQQYSAFKIQEYSGVTCCGSYEMDFIEKYITKTDIKDCFPVDYNFQGKIRKYHPDFYLESHKLIVEIKSTYTYMRYLEKNIAKQKSCLAMGYNFIFIIDKNYEEFNKIYGL